MTYQNNEEFSMELTDAELEEINGGALSILKGFPYGTINPELIGVIKYKGGIIPNVGFPNGMFPPIQGFGGY